LQFGGGLRKTSSPVGIGAVDLLSARFIARLLLSLLIADDALIGAMRRPGLGLWHAFLTAMLATLILRSFQIVFSRHGDRTFWVEGLVR
jgi:hypothetical protein